MSKKYIMKPVPKFTSLIMKQCEYCGETKDIFEADCHITCIKCYTLNRKARKEWK